MPEYRYDTETGLYYLQSRYYDPNTGRFVNADDTGTLNAEQGNPIQQNLYAYCLNNPANHIDSDGNWVLDAIFLAVDVVDFVRHPSVGGAAWVLFDCACFADPSGTASTGSHAVKLAHAAEETVRAVKEAAKAGEIVGRYRKVKAAVKGLGLETHHLIEKRFAKNLGVKSKDMLSVALTKKKHRIYTNSWRKIIPYGEKASRKRISRAINIVYKDNKYYRHAAHVYLKYTRY